MQPFVAPADPGLELHNAAGPIAAAAAADSLRRLRELGSALSRETDLQTLLEAIARHAGEIGRAAASSLVLIIPGEQGLEVRAEWSRHEEPRPRCYLDRYGPTRQALVTGRPVYLDGRTAEPDRNGRSGEAGKSEISVPLIYRDLILGTLNVSGMEANAAEAEMNIELLTTLASYAASALYAARLARQQEDRSAALRDLQQHSTALIGRAPESQILDEAAVVIAGLLETPRVAIFLHDPDTVGLRLGGASSQVSAAVEALADALHPGATPSGYTGGLLFLADVKGSSLLPQTVREAAAGDAIRSLIGFAVGNEQMAGLGLVLAVFEERPSLEAHQLELALLYASQVSLAIHTLRLSQEAAQTAREQAALFAISQALHSGNETEMIGQRVLDTLALALRAGGGCLLMGDLVDGVGAERAINGLQLVQTGTPHGQIEYYAALVASGLDDELAPIMDGDDWEALFSRLQTRFGLAGVLVVWRLAGAPRFTAREQELIQTVGNELARHLENRALIARELAAISDAAATDGAGQVSELAARIAERAWTLAHAEGAAVLLFDEDNDEYRVEAEFGELPDLRWMESAANIPFLNGLREPQMLFAGDYERLGGLPPADEDDPGQNLLLVPLQHDEFRVGVVVFAYGEALKYRSRLPFIQAMVQRAAMVLRNVQLQVDAEQLAMLEERNRIARTMHDGLAQQLAQIRFRTELVKRLVRDEPDRALRELENVQQELKKGIGGIRRTINSLEPVMMKKLGVKLALLKLAEDLSEDSTNPVQMTVEGDMAIRSLQAQLAVFRLAQEALSSVMNLHEEGECSCKVILSGDEVQVMVSHDGEPRVAGVEDLIREQLLGLVRNRSGEVEMASQDGRLVVSARMRLLGDGAPR